MKLRNVVGAVKLVGAVGGISYAAGAASTTTMTAAPELKWQEHAPGSPLKVFVSPIKAIRS